MISRTNFLVITAIFLLAAKDRRADAGLVLSVNAPGSQASTVSGVTTETFDSFAQANNYTSLSTAVGTITAMNGGRFSICGANQYGGANLTGNYFAMGAESGSAVPDVLTLKSPQAYFGFWFSAADAYNQVSFYSGSQLLASLNTPYLLNALGTLPNGSQYIGNPNNGADVYDKFVYVNVIAEAGTTISSIQFGNSNSTASGNELDNFSVASVAPSVIPGTVISGALVVPEPSSLMLVTIATTLITLARVTYKRKHG